MCVSGFATRPRGSKNRAPQGIGILSLCVYDRRLPGIYRASHLPELRKVHASPENERLLHCPARLFKLRSIRLDRRRPSYRGNDNQEALRQRGVVMLFWQVSPERVGPSMHSMQGKNAVIFGVANKRSIAWAIAQSLSQAGAKLAVTYQNERLKAEAHELISALPGAEPYQCDLSNDGEIDQLFSKLKERYGRLDALAHCVAHAPAEDLKGDFLNTSREGFRIAHDISVYTLIAVTRAAAPLMTEGGSVVT